LILVLPLGAQEYGSRLGTVQRGGRVTFEPTGPGVLFDALDPAVRKWYVPQELYREFKWKQWQYSNYAREPYERFVSTSLEGNYFYDLYGNFLTKGWLIYDWQQTNPQPFGSSLNTAGRFGSWFNNLVVASDHKGQYHYAITVGNQIRTTLTPMTFSKPLFNGIQWDFSSDKYTGTLLLSRISAPTSSQGDLPLQATDNTNLIGSRLVAQVGDFVQVGGTFVNMHHSYSRAEAFSDNLLAGNLLGLQNTAPVGRVEILIRDDSPEDGEGGGALFASDVLIEDLDGAQTRGSEIGFRALAEGGFLRRGYLAADGSEVIRLVFDFSSPEYTGPVPVRIRRVQVELVLANDYRVEISSDRQLGSRGNLDFTTVARAPGNVQDGSNQQVLAFDYGLPTAVQVAGFTAELNELRGFRGYMEVNLNHQYRQYPNPRLAQHHASSTRAEAWILNLSHTAYPYFAFAEAFEVSPFYTTSMPVVSEVGQLDYGNNLQRYELVEDNDDQDRRPDWKRKGWNEGDDEVFPGWDENNDFISDFNQNDSDVSPNREPDYEEPFLRFHVDRPEFLYGVDMNHNQWADRFENDEQPDYPYARDRKGYNLYGGAFLTPDLRLTLGQERFRQLSEARRTLATYALLSLDRRLSWGRVRLFQDLRRVRDTMRDDLIQWLQPPNTRGDLYPVQDALPAPNTWVNASWLGAEYTRIPGLRLEGKGKWQLYRQLEEQRQLLLRGLRRHASFLGLIAKTQYELKLGRLTLGPAWKGEWLRQTPVLRQEFRRAELNQLFMALLRLPVLSSSFAEGGVEYHLFYQLRDPPPPGAEDTYRELTAAGQLTNLTQYLGYRLTTIIGLQVSRRSSELLGTQTHTRGFMTVYAGVEK
jgi:hypothetical protein